MTKGCALLYKEFQARTQKCVRARDGRDSRLSTYNHLPEAPPFVHEQRAPSRHYILLYFTIFILIYSPLIAIALLASNEGSTGDARQARNA